MRFFSGKLIYWVVVCACSNLAWSQEGIRPAPTGEAPRAGMNDGRWSTGNKQFFGTSYESYDSSLQYSSRSATAPISKVWFTGAQGVMTEVFWPTLDMAQVRDSQFLITDGYSFFAEERKDTVSRVEWLEAGVPAFRVINRDRQGRFEIEKVIFTDPDRDVVLQRVKISKFVSGLQFFLLHHPTAGNTPMGDFAKVTDSALYAWQGNHAQAVVFSTPLKQVTAGFAGTPSDGWQDLSRNFILDSHYAEANDGNVVLTAGLDIPDAVGTSYVEIALGFGATPEAAHKLARASLDQNLTATLQTYTRQWHDYQKSVRDLSGASFDQGRLFRASVAMMKSMEDKTHPGAFVASPSVPWGEHSSDSFSTPVDRRQYDYNMTCGYHCVWPRDLYQMATAMLAINDAKSAVASLNYLKKIQFSQRDGSWEFSSRRRSKDGSFPQNTWVNGDIHWSGLQMDEVAMPVVLAYRLWKAGHIQLGGYWNMVKRASDFIQDFGPWSGQERWEENFGASPSTIASEISALWAAAEMADQMGDSGAARKYREAADNWSSKPGDNIDTWTFTTSGSYGDGRYYLRLTGGADYDQSWNPNDNAEYKLGNDAGNWNQKKIIDGGFLELVRFGIRGALNKNILDTMPKYDQALRVDIPGIGPSFHRYSNDRYNRDDASGAGTPGMLWPLLTGERGHYELAAAVESGHRASDIDRAVSPYIRAMEGFANASLMLPEQVWRDGPGAGKSTGSATPLGWAHGEYVKLLRSKQDRHVFDMNPAAVRRRLILMVQ